MEKLREILIERAARKPLEKKEENRSSFMACMDEIAEAIKEVWEALKEQKKISFGYDAFRRYVKRMPGSGNSTS